MVGFSTSLNAGFDGTLSRGADAPGEAGTAQADPIGFFFIKP